MSELHKQSYWEEIYKNEKKNYEESNIPLEEWFEENCGDKIINWIEKKFENKNNTFILDIGCGNGLFLYKLFERGFVNLYGMDYSTSAIELAKEFFNGVSIYVEVFDIYKIEKEIQNSQLNNTYELLNDKGTFDIFFMNKEEKEYFKQVSFFFRKNTVFIITSCNACKEEIMEVVEQFNQTNSLLKLFLIDEILYETFSFGGKIGQIITTLIFKCT